jgi:hypothetical protein
MHFLLRTLLLALATSTMIVTSTSQLALAQSDSIYPGGAAEVPDWLVEGKAGPPEYLAAQAELDARTARTQFLFARPDAWRYVVYQGHWWYYQPNHHWLVYDHYVWKPYKEPVVTTGSSSMPATVEHVDNNSTGK